MLINNRKIFTNWIGHISSKYKNDIDWWISAPSSRNPFISLLYKNICITRTFEKIIDKDIFTGEIFNAVTSNNTVQEVVNYIKKYVEEVKVDFVDTKIMNQLSYEVATKKVESLGFKLFDNLEEGIKETINLLSALKHNSQD